MTTMSRQLFRATQLAHQSYANYWQSSQNWSYSSKRKSRSGPIHPHKCRPKKNDDCEMLIESFHATADECRVLLCSYAVPCSRLNMCGHCRTLIEFHPPPNEGVGKQVLGSGTAMWPTILDPPHQDPGTQFL
ncbi:hypothetical protein BS50DRAFT_163844 [Corynespora cassiicola Philippines]|uniref:Uncharacterized protein n=1 Tax=Corynespora cassiicola Philippines TaxID=1448308 RepID=A0A2T2N6H4_CORCC|nr:hypothetical protein BS50DRAFT_163844 [Corynespora cassiicola Philippines]